MLTAVLLGLVLGLRHAFDPDHVAAVSAITARHRNPWTASWIGASWGLGHSTTVVGVGVAIIVLRVAIPDGLTHFLELGVGIVLVAIGISNLAAWKSRAADAPAGFAGDPPLRATLTRSGLVGIAHGLAGSAAIALLALAAMPTPAAALVYLLVFSVGTVVGMVGFSLAVSVPFAALAGSHHGRRLLTAGTGLASLLIGCAIVYRFGAAAGLPALG